MKDTNFVWLASYPRSGNTFLRTILWHCFGLRSASVYPKDLDKDLRGNPQLEDYVGHVEHGPDGSIPLHEMTLPLVKTHDRPEDDRPAIYVIRDGRAACVSLWDFFNRTLSLEDVIEGRHHFGVWSDHVRSWNPWERPYTLVLRYEKMVDELPTVLKAVSDFLRRDVVKTEIPPRNQLTGVDGRWIRKKTNWRAQLSGKLLKRFNELNRDVLKQAGYY